MLLRALLLVACLAAPSLRLHAETFIDVTASAGLANVQHTLNEPPDCRLASGFFCEPERMTGGVALADVDGDGHTDVFLTRLEAHDLLFRNLGGGQFADVTVAAGLDAFVLDSNGAAFADVDRDGDPDLFVSSIGGTRFHLFINDGNGAFSEEAVARGAAVATAEVHIGYGVAVGDYDRDGYPDLFVGEWRLGSLVADPGVSHSRLLRNRGAAEPGHFDDVTDAAGVRPELFHSDDSFVFAPAFVDLDGDGWQDLALASDFGTSLLFWNDGDGTFTEGTAAAGVGSDENGMGSTFGDYDGDGDLDWFVTSIYDAANPCGPGICNWGGTGNRLYRNEGGRSFSDATDAAGVREGYWGWGTSFFDADNDGDLELVMTNGVDFPDSQLDPPTLDDPWETDPLRYWRNDGSGGYAEVSAAVGLAETGSGKGLVTFDHDEDGDLDLLVVNNASGARLFENVGGNANDWLRVRVVHAGSTSPILGARVEVQALAGGPIQVREIGADAHFLAHGEAIAHFGLGAPGGGPVHRVRVRLPGGIGRVVEDVSRNTTIVLSDGVGCGLLGIEGLPAALGWLALRRRRRR